VGRQRKGILVVIATPTADEFRVHAAQRCVVHQPEVVRDAAEPWEMSLLAGLLLAVGAMLGYMSRKDGRR